MTASTVVDTGVDSVAPVQEVTAPRSAVDRRRGPDHRRRTVTIEGVVVVVFGLFGFRLGARPLTDNSMFTHLRTGVEMVRGHFPLAAIPRTDPYSWSALGHPWVVQSWLAEWSYGVLNHVGGLRLVVLEQGLLAGAAALLVARLARTGDFLRTVLAGGLALGAGVALWSPRPLLFGIVAFAALVTIVEERRAGWLLLPVAWIWVNTHGSFVLGGVWLVLVAVGALVDRRRLPWDVIRYGLWFGGGLLAAAVNPLGPRLLLFPLSVGEKSHVFNRVVEWRSPDFHQPLVLATAVCAVASVMVLARAGARAVPWRAILPVAVFLVLGLVAVRNFPLLPIVLAPALALALRPGAERRVRNSTVAPAAVAGIAMLGLLFAATAMVPEPSRTDGYPVDDVAFVHDQGLFAAPHHVVEEDFVGNYVELRYGSSAPVFVDDRVDMFPVEVSDDFHELKTAGPRALQILDQRHVDVVLWTEKGPLVTLLRAHGGWHEVHRSKDFVVLMRD